MNETYQLVEREIHSIEIASLRFEKDR